MHFLGSLEDPTSSVESVLRSHDPALVRDLSISLDLAPPTLANSSQLVRRGDDRVTTVEMEDDAGTIEETAQGSAVGCGIGVFRGGAGAGANADERSNGNGAVLVHGPPGVGKTRLVRETTIRINGEAEHDWYYC